MRILLADDEALSRERLRDLLQDIGESVEVVAEAANGLEALRMAIQHKPDTVLLDINMPGLDGIQCARELARLDEGPAVVFVTAHDDFALQAFEVAACDYLLKPVRKERLSAALAKAQKFTPSRWDCLDANLPKLKTRREYICAHRCGEIRLIAVGDVLYFHADQKYTTVKTLDGEALIEEPLKSLEQEFEGGFLRIHRNALVAAGCIERLELTGWHGGKLRLRGLSDPLDVSRRCLPTLRAHLKRLGKSD
ncbi:Transcriptional regulatory protein BtsR [Methylococcales bacterium]|nr:Transcriptional regulatory protein BtsR [Methylococcales bacterium]